MLSAAVVTGTVMVNVQNTNLEKTYSIYRKYWDTLSTYHTSPKIWNSPYYSLLMHLKYLLYVCL